MDRGFIIGMDLGTIDIMTSILLIFKEIRLLYFILIIGLILDIALRLVELKFNQGLKENQIIESKK